MTKGSEPLKNSRRKLAKRKEPSKNSRRKLVLVGGLAIAGLYGLTNLLKDDVTKFKPWTGEQKAGAYRKCVSSARTRDGVTTCVANAFCQCATANYEARGTPYEEFTESLLGAVTSYADGRFGYFCTDVAKNQCSPE
jgi:hypothetical protein